MKMTDLITETKSIRAKIPGFYYKVKTLDHRLSTLEPRLELLPNKDLEHHALRKKIVDLVERNHMDNVRFFRIPEKAEGANVRGFLPIFLANLLGITFSYPLEMQRAHRIRPK
ncbi:hypothetical protein NDU88_001607 [Pleurodeles waltl]|uniref:Uncharacterized protein n=1 Tax=Pleurodeles waltl TaxID=8319 RepID=A0AAV7VAW6_PLEWA|nr:hypothetical protein NDU88_001607 [Pleurodeles waltl]